MILVRLTVDHGFRQSDGFEEHHRAWLEFEVARAKLWEISAEFWIALRDGVSLVVFCAVPMRSRDGKPLDVVKCRNVSQGRDRSAGPRAFPAGIVAELEYKRIWFVLADQTVSETADAGARTRRLDTDAPVDGLATEKGNVANPTRGDRDRKNTTRSHARVIA